MKKLLSALLVAVILIISCCACGSDTKETIPSESTDQTHDHTHATTAPQGETQKATEPQPNGESEPAANPDNNTPAVTVPAKKPASITRGTYSGDKYTNSLLNLSFTLPEGWVYYSDSELCSLSGLSADTYSDFTNAAKNNPAVYDMYAIHKESGASVSLCYENLLYTMGSTLTAREYLEVIKAAVAGAGVSEIDDKGTVAFCSGSYEKATITSGNANTRQTHYLTAFDGYMVSIIVTSASSDAEAAITNMFS